MALRWAFSSSVVSGKAMGNAAGIMKTILGY